MTQTQYGNVVLTQIMRGLKNPFPKIQYKAIQAIQNFCQVEEEGENEAEHKTVVTLFTPFLEPILEEMARMMQVYLKEFNFVILSGVIGTLNSISTFGLPFDKYYNTFMPILKQILAVSSGDDQQKVLIRENTIECLGCLLTSIKDNKSLFVAECGSIMESLLAMADNLDKNDPLQRAIFTVYENVVEIVKGDFMTYAPRIIDRVLYAANVTVDCRVVDDAEISDNKNKRLMVLKTGSDMMGSKNIVLNTDSLQLKIEGARLLRSLSENMGPSFCPFIEKTLPTVTYNITFNKSKDFRQEMIVMAKFLVVDCQTPEQRVVVLNQVMHPLGNELSTAIQSHDEQEISLIMEVVLGVMPYMTEEMLTNMPKLLTSVLTATKAIVAEVEKSYYDKEMDE